MTSWRLSAASSGARRAGSALLPVPATDAQAFQARGVIYGGPRTPIPGPAPVPGKDREQTALAQGGWIGLPSSAFHAWAPSVMWTVRRTPLPVSVFSDNQMPVPAIDPRGKPAVMMPGPVMLNQFQVSNPRVMPKFMERNRRGR